MRSITRIKVRFAYVVRATYILVLFALIFILMRCFHVLDTSIGLDMEVLSYIVCSVLTVGSVALYFFKLEYGFNFVLTAISLKDLRRVLSAVLRSLDFLFYGFLKLRIWGLLAFIAVTVIPTLVVTVVKMTTLLDSRSEMAYGTFASIGTIHANLSIILLGLVLGYICRKSIAHSILKDYLRVVNLTDWARGFLVLCITVLSFSFSTYFLYRVEFVFGFCLGLSIDLYLSLQQRQKTYNIRRGLLTYTYVKNAVASDERFVSALLLGSPRRLKRSIAGVKKQSGDNETYYLMQCCYLFFRKRYSKLNDLLNTLPVEMRDGPWFRHLEVGMCFSRGDAGCGIEGTREILASVNSLDKSSNNLRAHLLVTLAGFYEFQYVKTRNQNDLVDAIDCCRKAVQLEEECPLAHTNLAYYLAESVDTFENGANEEVRVSALEHLNEGLYRFSNNQTYPWFYCSSQRTSFANMLYLDVRGYIYMKMGITRFAREDFADCILKDPLYAKAHLHLAELFERISPDTAREEDAAYQYLKAMTVLPQDPAHLPYFRHAQIGLKRTVAEEETGMEFQDRRLFWVTREMHSEKS
ncbi:MAG: hypothetical protein KAV87_02310 [Desulfobacteraceae bacterium]|nr:hypothetical protein [Desulfobacteraceae bacterium]